MLDSGRQRRTGLAVAGVLIAGLIVSYQVFSGYTGHSSGARPGPFDGVYDVTELLRRLPPTGVA